MNRRAGFTLTELSIVVAVIALLAAGVAAAFNGLKASANDSLVKSDLATNVRKMKVNILQNGHLPTSDEAASSPDYKVQLSKRSAYKFYGYCTAVDSQGGPVTEVVQVAGTVDGHMFMYSTEESNVVDVSEDYGVASTYSSGYTSTVGHPYKCWDYIKPGRIGAEFRDMVHWDGGVEGGYVTVINP